MVYTLLFFPSKCSSFHNSNAFGSSIIHILYTGCAKIKKNNSGAKRLTGLYEMIPQDSPLEITNISVLIVENLTGLLAYTLRDC